PAEVDPAVLDKIDEDIQAVKAELDGVAEKLDSDNPYDIVIDEEGVNEIAEQIKDKLASDAPRFDQVDAEIADLKNDIQAVQAKLDELAGKPAEIDPAALDKIDEDIQALEAKLDAVAEKPAEISPDALQKIDEDIQAVQAKLDELAGKPAEIDPAVIDKIDEEIQAVQAKLDELAEKPAEIDPAVLDKIDEDIQALEAKLDAVAEKPAEFSPDALQKIDDELQAIKEELDGVAERTADLDMEVLEKIDEDLEIIKTDVETIVEKPEADDTPRFDKIDEELEEIKTEIEDLSKTYDIVIDEEGVNEIAEQVKEKLGDDSDRFDKVDAELEEIKEELKDITVVEVYDAEPQPAPEDTDEPVPTVSDIIADDAGEEPETAAEPAPEEPAQEPEEEPAPEDTTDAQVLIDTIDSLDENLAEGEVEDEDLDGDGVDFLNMMKYNRSFIARIIQATDEQKEYYGRVKDAFLSYDKVNSNLSWGAERFHKGRETIARFKIRGKTLCLYLALDPAKFPESVYHQVDVSDNKSMHGTPMMVKIKSPRGTKKAIRLVDALMAERDGVKRNTAERDYVAMYPYEDMDELIDEGLVKDVSKNK
ncbi:MAG: septation ring formation regulator EzrA, partial [Clostridia bacterium]|nr:septation ring formation regulator EzrA [Clostridia bacterium]